MIRKTTTVADMIFADKGLVNKYVEFRPRPPDAVTKRVVQHLRKVS